MNRVTINRGRSGSLGTLICDHAIVAARLKQMKLYIYRMAGLIFVQFREFFLRKLLATVASLLLVGGCSASFAAEDITSLITGGSASAPKTERVIETDTPADSDQRIDKRLREIFSELDALKDIEISVRSGVVTLSGNVDSTASVDRAMTFARQIDNVVEVENEIVVDRDAAARIKKTWGKILALGQRMLDAFPVFVMALVALAISWLLGSWVRKRETFFRRLAPNYFVASFLAQIAYMTFVLSGFMLALILLDATAWITTLLGAAGIVGLAIGFAVRDTVENYIASILLSLRNPFEVNDLVSINSYEGNVVRLTARATILLSPDGNHIRIPNATVFKAVIVNFTRHPERRFQFEVGVDTEQNLLNAQSIALSALKSVDGVLAEPKPLVVIQSLGDSNVVLGVFAWVNQQLSSYLKVRSEAIRHVKKAFDHANIIMPEPIYKLRIIDQLADTSVSPQDRGDLSQPKNISADASSSNDEILDVSADTTIEKKINAEYQANGEENLLSTSAPKEL